MPEEPTARGPAADASHAERGQRGLLRLVRWIALSALALVLLRVFVLEPYGIPFDSPSMQPTILPGDVILVNKLPYTIRSLRYFPFTHVPIPFIELPGLGELERGDLVVFDFPLAGNPASEQYVKRCVALAGDTVTLREGRIRVNGREVPVAAPGDARPVPIERSRAWEPIRWGEEVIVPYEGMPIRLDSLRAELWRPLIESERSTVEFRRNIVFINGLPATSYTVRRDYFFALGDNSYNSRDSRFFGVVPYENLIGEPFVVYWSRTSDGSIRWDRIGTGLD